MPDSLIERFKAKAIIRGGVLIFTPADAIKLIEAAELEGRKILGIDGFFLTDKSTQPSLENSADYSAGVGRGANANQSALKFVQERDGRGLHFEIVLKPTQ